MRKQKKEKKKIYNRVI